MGALQTDGGVHDLPFRDFEERLEHVHHFQSEGNVAALQYGTFFITRNVLLWSVLLLLWRYKTKKIEYIQEAVVLKSQSLTPSHFLVDCRQKILTGNVAMSAVRSSRSARSHERRRRK